MGTVLGIRTGIRHLRRPVYRIQRSGQHPYVRGYRITMDVPIGAVVNSSPTPSRLKSTMEQKPSSSSLTLVKAHCSLQKECVVV